MKKILTIASLFTASAFTFLPTLALADPIGLDVTIYCPPSNAISNAGDYIAGSGVESISKQGDFPIYFKSTHLDPLVPGELKKLFQSGCSIR